MTKKEKDFKGKKMNQFWSNDLTEVECFNYYKKGHCKLSCPNNKRNEKCKKPHLKKAFVDIVVALIATSLLGCWTFASDTQKELAHGLKRS